MTTITDSSFTKFARIVQGFTKWQMILCKAVEIRASKRCATFEKSAKQMTKGPQFGIVNRA
jgi:hypothetical protein